MTHGRIAVITGTTHGIGRVTSREVARAGYTVVMLCRDYDGANRQREAILAEVPGATVHVVRCDLASLRSVREAVRVVRSDFEKIALLINKIGRASCRERV